MRSRMLMTMIRRRLGGSKNMYPNIRRILVESPKAYVPTHHLYTVQAIPSATDNKIFGRPVVLVTSKVRAKNDTCRDNCKQD